MVLTLEEISDIEAAWAELWPLHDALQKYHVGLTGGVQRPNADAGSRRRIVKALESEPRITLLVRDGSTAVGTGMGRLREGGWSGQEPVGVLSNFYIQPESRGTTVILEMHRRIEAWLRESGQRLAERGVLAPNKRTLRLWTHLGFEPYLETLRRDVSEARRGPRFDPGVLDSGGFSVAKVTDLGLDWPRIWPLLDQLDRKWRVIEPCELPANREQFRRQEIEKAMSGKARLLLAEHDGKPCGIAMARLIKNPAIFVERVGRISNFFIEKPQRGTALFWSLLDQLEGWLEKKGADTFETDVLVKNQRVSRLWSEIGYEPYMVGLRKELLG